MKKSYLIVGLMLLECIAYSDCTAVVRRLDVKTGLPLTALTVKNPQCLRPDQIIIATKAMVGTGIPYADKIITITV